MRRPPPRFGATWPRTPGAVLALAAVTAGCSNPPAPSGDAGPEAGARDATSRDDGPSGRDTRPDREEDSSSDGDAKPEDSGPTLACDGGREGGTFSAPSCDAGGAGRSQCGLCNESCCTSLEVASGTYDRTYANSGGGPEATADPAAVSGFRLDAYEVTVGRFRQYVAAWNGGAGYTPPAGSGKHTHLNGGLGLANGESPGTYETGWMSADDASVAPTDVNLACDTTFATWTTTPGGNEGFPMNCVTWYEAYAFCIWDGGFLPSEAEWEYAAAGGGQQREYPWGTMDPGSADDFAIYGCFYTRSTGSCTTVANLAPVGTAARGAGRWGQEDLAGNVWEWSLDAYGNEYADPCADCAELPLAPAYRVIRGGDFCSDSSSLFPARRDTSAPLDRHYFTGLRCARTP